MPNFIFWIIFAMYQMQYMHQLDDLDLRDDVYVVCGVDLNDQYLAKFDQYLIYDYDNPEEDIYLE